MSKFKDFFIGTATKVGAFVKEHSPQILLAAGVTSFLGSVVSAIFGTVKSCKQIEEEKEKRKNNGNNTELVPKEIVALVWKNYIPVVLTLGAGVTCIILANKESTKRLVALGAACALSEDKAQELQKKLTEKLGENKSKEAKAEILQEKVLNTPLEDNKITITGRGETLCFDPVSARYFRSSAEEIRAAVNEINDMMLKHEYASLNDFYWQLGLQDTSIGNYIGWQHDSGYGSDNGFLRVSFSTVLSPNNEPCLCMDYDIDVRPLSNKYI